MNVRTPDHWICLDCRKQFRRPGPGAGGALSTNPILAASRSYPCPECKLPLIDIGKYFRAPKRTDKRAWLQVRLLADHGVRFHHEGSVRFQKLLEASQTRRTQLALKHCSCHVANEGQRLLRAIDQYQARNAEK